MNKKLFLSRMLATVLGVSAIGLVSAQSTTWDGTKWSNGRPSASTDAVIAGNYTANNASTSFTAKSLTVNQGVTLTVALNTLTGNPSTIAVGNETVNNGAIILDNGYLNQTSGSAAYTGSGVFKVRVKSVGNQDKYLMWSSPVAGTNLYAIYPGQTVKYVLDYQTASDSYTQVASGKTAVAGKGYAVKVPQSTATVEFIGAPNIGDISVPLSSDGQGYNLVGNPYPTALDISSFHTGQSGIASTFWFWDSRTTAATTDENPGYAIFNASGQTWTAAPGVTAAPSGNLIKPGQAFFVQTTGANSTVTFRNNYKSGSNGTGTNRMAEREGKYWLRLTDAAKNFYTIAITHQQGASNTFDTYDSKFFGDEGSAFYSLADGAKLAIQGREVFREDDKVQLGIAPKEAGMFSLSLADTEGIFSDGQPVYLKDNLLNKIVNLKNGNYTFAAEAGDDDGRFEIVYGGEKLLGLNAASQKQTKVARDGSGFIITSPERITGAEIIDASGRTVKQLGASSSDLHFSISGKGMYIVKVRTARGETTHKILN